MNISDDKRATMAHITMLKLLETNPFYVNTTECWVADAVAATDALLRRLEETKAQQGEAFQ